MIQFLYCLLSSVVSWCDPMVDTEGKSFKFRSANHWNPFFLAFSWNFIVLWGVLRKSWLERYIQLSFMNGMVNLSGMFQKQKKKKKTLKFKIEFLLLFTSCRNLLGRNVFISIWSEKFKCTSFWVFIVTLTDYLKPKKWS